MQLFIFIKCTLYESHLLKLYIRNKIFHIIQRFLYRETCLVKENLLLFSHVYHLGKLHGLFKKQNDILLTHAQRSIFNIVYVYAYKISCNLLACL
jgi:hypothetical protein